MYNHLLLVGVALLVIGIYLYWGQKPQLGSLSAEELRDTAEYYNRLNRKGTFTPAKLCPVISIGEVKEAN